MNFNLPIAVTEEMERFKGFLNEYLTPELPAWYRQGAIPREFYRAMGKGRWFGFEMKNGDLIKQSAFKDILISENIARLSPGVAVTVLVHMNLGLMGLYLFGSECLKEKYGNSALRGETLICLGNTEGIAGSDVAGIAMTAQKVDGGWRLNGTKAYVTNGLVSDLAIISAVSDPDADRNRRLSTFLVDLHQNGVQRKKLHKQVWIPSDLTRIKLIDVFVPDDHLLGERGRGLQQVLSIFTHSRVPISALTLGTAVGAFELALDHGKKRKIFGQPLINFQAKSFEVADFFAKIEAVRLMIQKACWAMDNHQDFRLEASLAKYLAVMVAREVTTWAADMFGAASVMFEHPIHKFPMDAWASSLGEGTQDVQKLVIFREALKRYGT